MTTRPSDVHEREILISALEQPDSQLEVYLEHACNGNETLKDRICRMLQVARLEGSFMAKPVFELPPKTKVSEIDSAERVIGAYKLLQVIGEGGMGTVYMAEQSQPVERRVALKIIKAGMDSRQVIARFEAERQALAMMDHPNIAKVLDAGTTESGRPYFVMEWVKGVPITKYSDDKKLSIRERLELMVPVCIAIQHAHQKGIIHRDIKPGNVLVTQYDGKPVPKVIDFGIAKATAQKLTDKSMFTEFGQIIGTLEYMSPEQAEMNQLDIDTRSDVYSLGVLLYELLTGSTPLDGNRMRSLAFVEMLRAIREDEPPRPSNRLSTIDTLASVAANRQTEPAKLSNLLRGELDWIVLMALDKDRNRRYETANGLAQDIERYLQDEPVLACPPSSAYRFRKFAKRNKGLLASAIAVLLVFIVGLTGTTWQTIRATNAEKTAEQERDKKEIALREALELAASERKARESETAQRIEAENAKEEARKQEAAAQEYLAISNVTLQFLQKDILDQAGSATQANSGYAPNPDLTVREALVRAANSVNERFSEQPLVEASIRYVLGESFREISEIDRAIEQMEKSLAITEEILGREHINSIRARTGLASSYMLNGRTSDAETIFKELYPMVTRLYGKDNSISMSVLYGLANNLARSNRPSEVIQLLESLVKNDTSAGSPGDDVDLGFSLLLANAYVSVGIPDEAISILEKVREKRLALYGSEHPMHLDAMHNLAIAYSSAGRKLKSRELNQKVIDAKIKVLGPYHSDTLVAIWNAARVDSDIGDYSSAIEKFTRFRDARLKLFGADHPDTLFAIDSLAVAYDRSGRSREAIELYKPVVEKRKQTLAPEDVLMLKTLYNFGGFKLNAGRFAEAAPILQQARDAQIKVLGPTHPDTLTTADALSKALDGIEKLAKSTSSLEQQYRTLTEKLGGDNEDSLSVLALLGRSYWEANQFDKAIPIFERLVEQREKDFGRQNDLTMSAIANLGVNYLAAKRAKEAIPFLKEAYQSRYKWVENDLLTALTLTGAKEEVIDLVSEIVLRERKRLGADSTAFSNKLSEFGLRLIGAKAWHEAEEMLQECLSMRQKLLPDDWKTFNTKSMLGETLLGQGELAAAETLLLEGYEGLQSREQEIKKDAALYRLTQSLERLVQLYTALEKNELREEWQSKLEKLREQITTESTDGKPSTK